MRLAALALAFTSAAYSATYYVTVAGLGGEPDYEQRFTTWAKDLDKLLHASGGDIKVRTLFGNEATRDRLRGALEEIAREVRPDDALVLMLIGHGTHDGVQYKFNIPGPDISGVDLAGLLDRVPAARQLVVNMTSASGGSIPALQKENRAIITATKSGTERNAVVFARYWVEALRDASADTDKNEVISALEAFRYADKKTAEFYESQKRLATEHALLEDSGRGEGVREPSPETGQGLLAARFPLLRIGAVQIAAQDPAKRKLLAKKEELEQKIDKLKYEKAAMPYEQYRKELADLLIELAKTQAELDQ